MSQPDTATSPSIECWIVHFQVPVEAVELAGEWFGDGVLVDEGDGEFNLYLEDEYDQNEWEKRFLEFAQAAGMTSPIPFEILPVEAQDWVAKTQIKNFCITIGRFVIYDPFYKDVIPSDLIPICVDAQFSFGAGDHPTTKGCLQALDDLAKSTLEPQSMLDIGCGTGILSIAMAKLWEGPIFASDIKSTAVDATRQNTAMNELSNRITCIEADGLHHDGFKKHAPYQLICANVLANILIDIAPNLSALISSHATIILSGILTHQTEQVLSAYEKLGFKEQQRFPIGDWMTLTLAR